MSVLVQCQNIEKSHGSRELFQQLSLSLVGGDRIGLIGPNGAGKSSLLKLLAGVDHPDDGEIILSRGIRIGYVPQEIELSEGTVEEEVSKALTDKQGYEKEAAVKKTIAVLGFQDPAQPAAHLSGGWKRRLSIAKALVKEPDLLLLDEPTNHLDLESILWLEGFLLRCGLPFIVTSHDRVFLDSICNKTWEISPRYPGGIFMVDAPYGEFLERKTQVLEAQLTKEKGLRSKMRREEEWLRQTPKARTTKSRSRIQEAARLKQELASIKFRNQEKQSQISLGDSGKQTRKLLAGKNLSKSLGERPLFSGFDLTLYRGDRIGIGGDNGSGKSTLLRIFAGQIASDSGTLKLGEGVELFLFDQHREQLDLQLPLRSGLAPDGDTVRFRGKSIHVNSWAERFLFPKERLDLPMRQLSGGERARVLIARLMLRSPDVLLLDEPTNDLDIDTLEILEQSLDDFPGAVILVTHDRAMMDRVVEKLIVLTGAGPTQFQDTGSWLDWRKENKPKKAAKEAASPSSDKPKKLSYKEQMELKGIEERILGLEEKIEALAEETLKPEISGDSDKLQSVCDAMAKLQQELEETFHRWEELENRK